MKNRSRASFHLLICGLIVAAAMPGCDFFTGTRKKAEGVDAKNANCEPGKQVKLLTKALKFGPLTFNPFVDSSPDTLAVTRNLFATLLDYDAEKNRVDDTGLASSVNAEGDGVTYTIKIRKALFSDGGTLDSEDVVYSYQTCLKPEVDSLLTDLLKYNDKDTEITAPDKETVTIKFPKPLAADVVRLIFARVPIVSKNSFDAAAKAADVREAYGLQTPVAKLVSSGPFAVKSYAANELVLEANKKYWKVDSNGLLLPYADEVKILLNLDDKTQSEKFAAGSLDVIDNLTMEKFGALKGDSKVVVADKGVSNRVWTVVCNTRIDRTLADPNKSKHFLTPGFRWAMSQASNRDRLVQEVMKGGAKPAYNIISPGNSTWFNGSGKNYPYNMEAAKTQLTAMGYKSGADLRDQINQPVRFSFMYPKDPEAAAIAQVLMNDYKALGIIVRPQEEKWETWWKILNRGAFDVALVEIQPEFTDPVFIQQYVTGRRLWAINGPVGAFDVRKGSWYIEIQTAFEKGAQLKSVADRKDQYNKVQTLWSEQCPVIYLMSENLLVGAKAGVGNVRFSSLDPGASWNLEELYVK